MHISPLRTLASAPSVQRPRFKGVFTTYKKAEQAPDYDPEKGVDIVEIKGKKAYLTGKEQDEHIRNVNDTTPYAHLRYSAKIMTWVNQAHPQPNLWDILWGKR